MATAKLTGLSCPLCGSWYNGDPEVGTCWKVGERCDNQAMTGPNPLRACPEHPCPGRLVLARRIGKERKRKTVARFLTWLARARRVGAFDHVTWGSEKRSVKVGVILDDLADCLKREWLEK